MLKEIVVENLDEELRVDKYLPDKLEDISRSELKKFFEEGKVRVNDKVVKPSFKVKNGDIINVEKRNDRSIDLEKEDIPLEIVYEDDDLIVVNKPSGMVVHPAAGHHNGTLVNALLHHCDSLSDYGGSTRAGIVHRIDKDTSGLLVACKNNKTHRNLAEQFKNKETTTRLYYAIVTGNIAHNLGKIRVHMAYIGHPVLNDPLYGVRKQTTPFGQYLHAKTLGFVHPTTGKYMEFDSELPKEFKEKLEELREN